jgi:hypothetical protein
MFCQETMRICSNCNLNKSYVNKQGYENWYRHKDGFLCQKCHVRLIAHPKRIQFKDKRITLKQNPRKGICSKCGKKAKTHIHHIKYHKENALKDTIELCGSCHLNESWRLGSFDNTKVTRNGRFFTGREKIVTN